VGEEEVAAVSERFFKDPILNSPYECPSRHWELDKDGIPTQRELNGRRESRLITPIPKPKKRGGKGEQAHQRSLEIEAQNISTDDQQYEVTQQINSIRALVEEWRQAPESQWKVSAETTRLLKYWRHHEFQGIRPFFCQIEAAETAIWLTEVAPEIGKRGKDVLEKLESANDEANPDLFRMALKLATGAGKTTVMAMLIAWQTINAARHPGSSRFTKGFLVVAPGLTIRDRLRVLQPNDTESYFRRMKLVPQDLVPELGKARIVITNYHAFRKRELLELAKGTERLLVGPRGKPMETKETEGQMLQRVMSELMGMKQVLVINDEAHHCYREKPLSDEERERIQLSSEEKAEAKSHREAARLWISGLEAVSRKIGKGQQRVIDLSATPFFLASSGYREGTLFPWTVSDFSLMDAIECGIVKLPRVPVADNIAQDVPRYRELWKNIKSKMPKKGRGKGGSKDPESLPTELKTAIEALYGHYEKTFEEWKKAGFDVPPCFIIVCNNTSTSKLVYDYVSGYEIEDERGDKQYRKGFCPLFWNYDDNGNAIPRPRTLLIDSEQLESGEALDANFREMAGPEIEQFRREIIQREGAGGADTKLSDADLLREVMNTVGKPGKLGADIRCVVSVAMLTEGWDANTVTHVLGVRAFGTQLLCEQVVGRALRRQRYIINPDTGRFDVEYADILGIPFDFTSQAVPGTVKPPPPTIQVKAISPARDAQEILFPHVIGYRAELPDDQVKATFNDDHILDLTPELVGATVTNNQGIIGEGVNLTVDRTGDFRKSTVILHLAKHLVYTKYRDADELPKIHLILQMKKVVRDWMEQCLVCKGGTNHGLLMFREMADMACERMIQAIVVSAGQEQRRLAILDPYNPSGSTMHVNFNTSKTLRWETDSRRCHVNWAICDSTWEQEFCRVLDHHPRVRRWVKNQTLGFEVPYQMGGVARKYIPDFIVVVDDGRGDDDLLHLVCEVKGYRGEDAKVKKTTMEAFWVPGVNNSGRLGRWGFAEFREVYAMETDFASAVDDEVNQVLDQVLTVEVV
jgi:type III restriction enzyme